MSIFFTNIVDEKNEVHKLHKEEPLRKMPPNTGYDYEEKAVLSKSYWNPKKKYGLTTRFLEIIKQP